MRPLHFLWVIVQLLFVQKSLLAQNTIQSCLAASMENKRLNPNNYVDLITENYPKLNLDRAHQIAQAFDGKTHTIEFRSVRAPYVADKRLQIDEYSVVVTLGARKSASTYLTEMAKDMDAFLGGPVAKRANFKRKLSGTPYVNQVIDIDLLTRLPFIGWRTDLNPKNAPVIIADIQATHFTVMTLKYNGEKHPLNGSRRWGYELVGSNPKLIRFYTRAVAVEDAEIAEKLGPSGESDMWRSWMDSMKEKVKKDGGTLQSGSDFSAQDRVATYNQLITCKNTVIPPPPTPLAIPNGIYHIRLSSGFALDAHASTINQNNGIVHIWDFHGQTTQQWRLTYIANGRYFITLPYNGKALDAAADRASQDGCPITIWDKAPNELNEQWTFVPVGNGYYKIQSVVPPYKVIDVIGDAIRTAGTKVNLWSYVGAPSQQWRLDRVSASTVNIAQDIPNLTAETRENTDLSLQISPNPSIKEINISWMSQGEGEATLSIHTADGQIIEHRTIKTNMQPQQSTFDISQLPNGMYFLSLRQNNQQTITKRFVKIE